MTMSEHDLDERLRSFGHELDRQSHARPGIEYSGGSRSRAPLVVAAGLVATVVGGLAVIANTRDRAPEPPAPATQPERAPEVEDGLDAQAFAATTGCAQSLERFVNSDMPAEVAANVEWPALDAAQMLAFEVPGEPSQIRILITDTHAAFTCKADRDATTETTVHGDLVDNGLGPFATPPGPGQIDVVSASGTSYDLGVGPGTALYVGRVGADVTAVTAVLPDGSRQPGAITDGWFMIDVDFPDGVELLSDDQISWTLATGDERIGRVDLLDEQTAAERCAAEKGCVESRLEQLATDSAANPTQAETLSDRHVTNEERRAHQEAHIECLVDAGVEATITPNGRGHIITNDSTSGDELDSVDVIAAQHECAAQHLAYVAEAFDLLDAQSRIDDQ